MEYQDDQDKKSQPKQNEQQQNMKQIDLFALAEQLEIQTQQSFLQGKYQKDGTYIPIIARYNAMKPQIFNQKDFETFRGRSFYYICGHDIDYNPIVVFNGELLVQQYQTNYAYMVQNFIDVTNVLLKKRIKQWHVILDLGDKLITDLPMIFIRKFMDQSMKYCPERLKKMYLVRGADISWFTWRVFQFQLPQEMRQKIYLSLGKSNQYMFLRIHVSQIQQKYGGDRKNLKYQQLWPVDVHIHELAPRITIQQFRKITSQKNQMDPLIFSIYENPNIENLIQNQKKKFTNDQVIKEQLQIIQKNIKKQKKQQQQNKKLEQK